MLCLAHLWLLMRLNLFSHIYSSFSFFLSGTECLLIHVHTVHFKIILLKDFHPFHVKAHIITEILFLVLSLVFEKCSKGSHTWSTSVTAERFACSSLWQDKSLWDCCEGRKDFRIHLYRVIPELPIWHKWPWEICLGKPQGQTVG